MLYRSQLTVLVDVAVWLDAFEDTHCLHDQLHTSWWVLHRLHYRYVLWCWWCDSGNGVIMMIVVVVVVDQLHTSWWVLHRLHYRYVLWCWWCDSGNGVIMMIVVVVVVAVVMWLLW